MELKNDYVVVLRNGTKGLVMSFQGKPLIIEFGNYSNPITKYSDFKQKNSAYDIVAIYNGSEIENPMNVFRKTFKVEELPLVWSES